MLWHVFNLDLDKPEQAQTDLSLSNLHNVFSAE